MRLLILIASVSLLLFTGCNKEDEHGLDDKERKAVAAEVAKNWVDRKQNRELVVKNVELPGNDDVDVLFVHGYYKDTKEEVDIMVEEGPEENDFKVASIGTDK